MVINKKNFITLIYIYFKSIIIIINSKNRKRNKRYLASISFLVYCLLDILFFSLVEISRLINNVDYRERKREKFKFLFDFFFFKEFHRNFIEEIKIKLI